MKLRPGGLLHKSAALVTHLVRPGADMGSPKCMKHYTSGLNRQGPCCSTQAPLTKLQNSSMKYSGILRKLYVRQITEREREREREGSHSLRPGRLELDKLPQNMYGATLTSTAGCTICYNRTISSLIAHHIAPNTYYYLGGLSDVLFGPKGLVIGLTNNSKQLLHRVWRWNWLTSLNNRWFPNIHDVFKAFGGLFDQPSGDNTFPRNAPSKKHAQHIANSLNFMDFPTKNVKPSVFWLIHEFENLYFFSGIPQQTFKTCSTEAICLMWVRGPIASCHLIPTQNWHTTWKVLTSLLMEIWVSDPWTDTIGFCSNIRGRFWHFCVRNSHYGPAQATINLWTPPHPLHLFKMCLFLTGILSRIMYCTLSVDTVRYWMCYKDMLLHHLESYLRMAFLSGDTYA